MALRTVIIDPLVPTPYGPIATLACGTGATQGFTFTLATYAAPAKVVSVTGDADWFYSNLDGAATVTSMLRVRADQPLRLSVHTPVTIYCRSASGTVNLWVAVEM